MNEMNDRLDFPHPRPTFIGKIVSVGEQSWIVPYTVKDARRIADRIIMIYDYMCGPKGVPFQNLEAFDDLGTKLWTAQNPSNSPADAYVEFMSEYPLVVWNFACYRCTIDPSTGRLLNAVFTK